MTATFSKTITEADIVLFARASGDNNAIHINENFAKTIFGGRIAHGFLTASTISAAVANPLPGPGTIYMEQSMRFLGPGRPGDTVDAVVTMKGLHPEKCQAVLSTVCSVNDCIVVDGEARVKTTSSARRLDRASKARAESPQLEAIRQ